MRLRRDSENVLNGNKDQFLVFRDSHVDVLDVIIPFKPKLWRSVSDTWFTDAEKRKLTVSPENVGVKMKTVL